MPMRLVRRARRVIRNPNFWPIVQLCSTLVMIALVGYIVWIASTEHSARAADRTASAKTRVTDCFNRNRQGPASTRFFDVLTTILENQVVAASSVIAHGGPNAKAYRMIRARALISLQDIRSFEALTANTTPTRRQCLELAHTLGVRTSTDGS